MKKILTVFLSFLLFVNVFSVVTFADVPSTQKAVAHQGGWGNYDFDYLFHGKYWTIDNATGIPTGSLLSPKYFYTDDNERFFASKEHQQK